MIECCWSRLVDVLVDVNIGVRSNIYPESLFSSPAFLHVAMMDNPTILHRLAPDQIAQGTEHKDSKKRRAFDERAKKSQYLSDTTKKRSLEFPSET